MTTGEIKLRNIIIKTLKPKLKYWGEKVRENWHLVHKLTMKANFPWLINRNSEIQRQKSEALKLLLKNIWS